MNKRLNANSQAVLDAVGSTTKHPTAMEVYEMVKQKRPGIGIASVYRILHQLVEQGYIRELTLGDESSRYDANTSRHDHAICRNCGLLLDVPVDLILPAEELKQAAEAAGITFDTHEVRLYGLCASCQQSLAEKSPTYA
jgi:Fur family transcriptional regulator, peroxide stress response regulator